MEPKKFIDFIITQKCTYRCPYCSQSKNQTDNLNNASKETIEAFYRFLDTLDKDFEITITGGEAILHPDFYSIIETIKQRGFKINLISNLSFSLNTYLKIFDILGDNLNIFDISLHINQIQNFNLTIEKLENFIKAKPQNTKTTIFIPLYLIDKKQEEKIEKILKLTQKYNVAHSFQKIRFLNSYKEEQSQKYISKHKKQNTFSKLCHAGSKSAVIYENGNVYRCYSSRFLHSNYLGNINDDNFKLNNCPITCSKKQCNCPKPKKYNQILIERDYKTAFKNMLLNYLYLPKHILKNRTIIKTKIKQLFNIT